MLALPETLRIEQDALDEFGQIYGLQGRHRSVPLAYENMEDCNSLLLGFINNISDDQIQVHELDGKPIKTNIFRDAAGLTYLAVHCGKFCLDVPQFNGLGVSMLKWRERNGNFIDMCNQSLMANNVFTKILLSELVDKSIDPLTGNNSVCYGAGLMLQCFDAQIMSNQIIAN